MKIFLPMVGMVQSLNISASFAQVLFHLRTVGRIRPDLEDIKIAAVHEKWIINAARNPVECLDLSLFTVQTNPLYGDNLCPHLLHWESFSWHLHFLIRTMK
uniref:Uncharacterized protein n=1 Tax=Rhodosorus marinus TaxID=101924 RepID=A0A7S0BU93_9RHOD|mmetsp:Transcript_9002/g.13123  ORF Transcript_9002/g.13123 Transcript_9002/m.13123 type:complete len:101 (+) Transcript_9002:229-531(+)